MQNHKKVNAGFFHPDEKGIQFPPAQSLQMSIDSNEDWLEIAVQKTQRDRETQR